MSGVSGGGKMEHVGRGYDTVKAYNKAPKVQMVRHAPPNDLTGGGKVSVRESTGTGSGWEE